MNLPLKTVNPWAVRSYPGSIHRYTWSQRRRTLAYGLQILHPRYPAVCASSLLLNSLVQFLQL